MIDRAIVSEWFAILCNRFNKEPLHPKVFALYVEAIEEDIQTNEEFVLACKKVFKHNKFFPTPGEFGEAIGKSAEIKAQEEMASIWDVASGKISWGSISISPAAKEALRLIGGLNRLRMAEERERSHLEKRFLEAWKAKEYLNSIPEEKRPIAAIDPGMENAAAYKIYSPPPLEIVQAANDSPLFKGLAHQWAGAAESDEDVQF